MATLKQAFEAFASFGGTPTREMDNAHFVKMLKESNVIDKVFTTTDADLLFNKIKAKGERKIGLAQMKAAIEEIAKKKKTTPQEIEAALTANPPGVTGGTKADHVGLHDDKSQYTGVYKSGGPTNVDRDAGNLGNHVDRRVIDDVRGVTH